MLTRKTIIHFLVAVIFWLIIFHFFMNHSILRPFCIHHAYKELIVVGIIIIAVYFNYFILIPKLFLKGEVILFFSLAILSIVLTAVVELCIVQSDIRHCFSGMTPSEYNSYLISLLILITFRNSGFFILFFLFRIYRHIEEVLLQNQRTFADKMKQIGISTSANKEVLVALKDITYLECERNKTTFYLINGRSYSQYSSLIDMEEIIPKNLYVRVNRSTILMYKYVVSFTDSMVNIKVDKEGELKSFKISNTNKENVLRFINLHFEKKNSATKSKKTKKKVVQKAKQENFGVKRDKTFGVTKKTAPILEEIVRNPGQNATALAVHFPNITKRTIENYIRELRDLDLIVYEGSPRKGGYYPKK